MDFNNTGYTLTKAEYVYFTIKEAILSGELEPNSKLVIRNIAENLKVSDIPVREALRRLETERLVKIIPHTGVVVSDISVREIEEGLIVRNELEPLAFKLAIKNITDDDITLLKELVNKMTECAHKDDFQLYGRLNKEFHMTIYKKSQNETLCRIIAELWNQTERLRAIFRLAPFRMMQSNKEHELMVEALEKGDEVEAERLIKEQRLQSSFRYLSYLKNYHK
ncbi:GntR family transcriptional regulator [Moorella sulfitireducens]|uniref:GntR family transcriptional regulator n=1 Tax=Neomoorella sulfitireducens TaxID=2972948 RepID=UPI0021ABF1BB|nr:GntR family transcriptional regulator [Moorella sulfitireducens]